jgi:phage FluMu protein Com
LNNKIQFCCRRCGHRLFDYIGGEFMIELKCEKCKRVLIARCATYQELMKKAQKGKVTV